MKNKTLVSVIILAIAIIGGVYYFAIREKPVVPTEKVAVRIGHLALVQPIFVAQEKGYLAEAGLDVQLQKFSNANLIMEALSRGEIDGVGTIAYSTLFAFENSSPDKFRIYHGASETKDTGFSALIVKKNSGITSPEQLKGKKIVMRSGLSSKSQGEVVIKAIGLDIKDVEFIQVESSLLISVFAKDEISAFLDIQPFATMIVQKGLGEVLIVSPRAKYVLNPYPLAGAVLSREFIAKNPDVAKKFKSAIEKAIEFIRTNETEARKIFQKYLELEENIAINMPLAKFEKVSEVDREAVAKLADYEVEHKILDKKPDTTNFFFEN